MEYNENTCIGKVYKALNEPIYGHPSREEEQRIKRLEKVIMILAQEIETTRSMIP